MWGAIAAAGASLAGSLFGANSARKSAKENNETQLQIARENNALMKEQFEKKTQIRMEDYKKAGVNPILAGLDAGAIPTYGNVSGLQNTGQPFADMGNNIANLATNLYNAKKAREIQQQSVNNQLITQEANAKQAQQQARLTQAQANREEKVNESLDNSGVFKDKEQIAKSIYGTPESEMESYSGNVLGVGGSGSKSSTAVVIGNKKKQKTAEQASAKQIHKQETLKERDKKRIKEQQDNARNFANSTKNLSFRK